MKTETITFRPGAELREPLAVACVRLGVTASDLIRDCLRESLAAVVARRVRYSPPKAHLNIEEAIRRAGNN